MEGMGNMITSLSEPLMTEHAIRTGNESRAINAFRGLVRRKNWGGLDKKVAKKLSKVQSEMLAEDDMLNGAENMEDNDDSPPVVLVGQEEMLKTGNGDVNQRSKKQSKFYVFSNSPKKVTEKAMLKWGVLLGQQSDRGLPRTYFPQGGLSTEKLNCHEYRGLLLLYALFIVSTIGTQFLGSKDKAKERMEYRRQGWLGEKHRHQWLRVLERLFLHDAFVHSDGMTKEVVQLYHRYIPYYLNKIKLVVNRLDGVGMKYLKHHALLHVPHDIFLWAVPKNTDTEVGESNHKEITKKTAARTQMRSRLLDWQTAQRYWENLVVMLASSRFLSRVFPNVSTRKAAPEPTVLPRGKTCCFGEQGIFTVSYTHLTLPTICSV